MISTESPNKRILQLALPMALTQLITAASGFLCMTMLASLGQDVLAASALIFSISTSIAVVGMSLLFALSILIGHAYGERDYLGIGAFFQQGWLLGILISLPMMLVFWYIRPLLLFLGQEQKMALIAQDFFRANIWRVLPLLLSVCNQQLCYGVHKQRIDLLANFIGIIVLLVSAYLLIFGAFGFPALGVAGFGYANALQGWFYFLTTLACISYLPFFKRFELFRFRIHQSGAQFAKLLKTGWPISLQINSEMLSFIVTATLVGWLGTRELAAYQIIMQYQFLVVIPIFALAQASGILIGQAYGAKQFADIAKLGRGSLMITALIGLVTGLIFIIFSRWLASLYLNVNDKSIEPILHLTLILFVFMAISQFFDALRNVLTGSLRGLLDTKFPMWVGIACIWLLYLPLACLLALPLHLGMVGIYLSWTVAVLLGACILFYRWQVKEMRSKL